MHKFALIAADVGKPRHFSYLICCCCCRFSRVRLCATPWMAAHQAPPSLGFSRQEHWSGLPFPSPMHESEKWKWSHSVFSDSYRPRGLQPTRPLCPWDPPGKSTGVGCYCLLQVTWYSCPKMPRVSGSTDRGVSKVNKINTKGQVYLFILIGG